MFRTPKRARLSSESSDAVVTPPPRYRSYGAVTPDSSPAVTTYGSGGSPSPGGAHHVTTNCNGPASDGLSSSPAGSESRRGRPRAEVLNSLRMQGYTSPSSIKCTYCNRVFPREKSLQAHLRTHTGERPYICDYPRCTRSFAQSGQLKTHQRLHTGEKPFVCGWTAGACLRRFTHANRHCPDHPDAQLRRFSSGGGGGGSGSGVGGGSAQVNGGSGEKATIDDQHRREIQRWMDSVKRRDVRLNYNGTPKKSSPFMQTVDPFSGPLDNIENYDYTNIMLSPSSLESSTDEFNTPKNQQMKSDESSSPSYHSLSAPKVLGGGGHHKSLFGGGSGGDVEKGHGYITAAPMQLFKEEDEMTLIPNTPLTPTKLNGRRTTTTELPKKRWLRKATLELEQSTSLLLHHQDLASPLNWGEDTTNTSATRICSTLTTTASDVIENENLKRPTVLMRTNCNNGSSSSNSNGSCSNGLEDGPVRNGDVYGVKTVSKVDMQIAMALMDLKNNGSIVNYRI